MTLLGAASCLVLQAQVTFTALGDLPGGPFESHARAVSADGKIVVGDVSSGAGVFAAVWKDGVLSTLAMPAGAVSAVATGVSLDGKVITGNVRYGDVYKAVVWTDGVPTELNVLPGTADPIQSWAAGVSADGNTIVGSSASDLSVNPLAVSWQGGAVSLLGDFPGGFTDSAALAVNSDGSVKVGFGVTANAVEAARWENGTMTGLGDLPGGLTLSRARAVSADGAFVVGESWSDRGREPFLWSNNQMIGLGGFKNKSDFDGEAYSVSLGGQRVVGTSSGVELWTAFLWTPENGLQVLEEVVLAAGIPIGGWHLKVATAITPDGSTIVGYGYNLYGQTEAWKITLDPLAQVGAVPEPSTYSALAALALIGGAAARRWRRTRAVSDNRLCSEMVTTTPARGVCCAWLSARPANPTSNARRLIFRARPIGWA